MTGPILFDEHSNNSLKNGCSSSVEAFSRDVPCIRSVFNVSFSHQFMGGYLTQIWSIYVRSSLCSYFNRRPSTDNSWIPLSLGCKTRPRAIFSGFPHFCAFFPYKVSTNINNRPRNSSFKRRFRTRVTNCVNYLATYTLSTRGIVFFFRISREYYMTYCNIFSRMLICWRCVRHDKRISFY